MLVCSSRLEICSDLLGPLGASAYLSVFTMFSWNVHSATHGPPTLRPASYTAIAVCCSVLREMTAA